MSRDDCVTLGAAGPDADYSASVPYTWMPLRAPVLQGILLKLFCWITRSPIWFLVYRTIAGKSGVPQALVNTSVPEHPIFQPAADQKYAEVDAVLCQKITGKKAQVLQPNKDRSATFLECFSPVERSTSAPGPTISDYHEAYKSGRTDPRSVAMFILNFLIKHNSAAEPAPSVSAPPPPQPRTSRDSSGRRFLYWVYGPLGANVLEDAEASAARWRAGRPLSLLDGVPFAVKDHMNVAGYHAPSGTLFPKELCTVDCPAVAALREAGAIMVAKTTMSELGMSPVGVNVHFGTARNPWNLSHICGGSSSGSAAIVAAGLVPFALGSDGGGSVRIPASLCGVFGLLPTHSRIPSQVSDRRSSCTTYGPLAGCPADCALVYSFMAKRGVGSGGEGGPADTPLLRLPKVSGRGKLAGVRVGVYPAWNTDASEAAQHMLQRSLQTAEALGAEVVELGIPDLELVRVAHTASLGTDAFQEFRRNHLGDVPRSLRTLSHHLEISFASLSQMRAADYVAAARVRGRATAHMAEVFKRCDVFLSPATPAVAPALADSDEIFDLGLLSQTMKFAQLANLAGLPAVSVPCGMHDGLPLGLQVMAPAWHEASLLAIAHVLHCATSGLKDDLGLRQVTADPLAGTAVFNENTP